MCSMSRSDEVNTVSPFFKKCGMYWIFVSGSPSSMDFSGSVTHLLPLCSVWLKLEHLPSFLCMGIIAVSDIAMLKRCLDPQIKPSEKGFWCLGFQYLLATTTPYTVQQEAHHGLQEPLGLLEGPLPDTRVWGNHQQTAYWTPLPGQLPVPLYLSTAQIVLNTFLFFHW